MSRDLTILSDFFNPSGVGSFPFNDFQSSSVSKYPLTNISYDKKTDVVYIEVALAGCPKDSITIKQENNFIIIEGEVNTEEENEDIEYVQKHIAQRKFYRKIKLAPQYVQGTVDASYEDGLLTLSISPSEDYSKKIQIK